MKLKSFSVGNYKAFKRNQTIDLNNLTLFFGYNNTGKSALVRALPLLSDSMKVRNNSFYTPSFLDYSSESVRGGLFSDITTSGEHKLSFGLHWENESSFDFTLQQSGLEPEKMTSLRIRLNGETKEYQESIESDDKMENKDNRDETINFSGFRLSNSSELNDVISNFSNSVHWVSSTRVHPPREFDIGVGVSTSIDHKGNGIGPAIWALYENNSPSITDINHWLTTTCGRKIDFSSTTTSSNRRRKVKLETVSESLDSPFRVAILDSGEGIAQALPVVVLAAMAANGELGSNPIITIEQPELHLHPQASIDLANFIISCIKKNSNVNFVLETHSESFLRALQIAIVDASLDENNFSCYWISMTNEGANVEPIGFDSEGYISNAWPQDVFRETINQAKELVSKRRAVNED
ncbi:AAA family ATPase [Vibrio splendidus]